MYRFAQVQLFRWVEKDDGVQELQTECGYHGHILALHMQVNGARVWFATRLVHRSTNSDGFFSPATAHGDTVEPAAYR